MGGLADGRTFTSSLPHSPFPTTPPHPHPRQGLGDYTLKSTAAQLLFPVYAVVGLLLFGMTVYTVRQVILEFMAVRLSLQLYNVLTMWSSGVDMGVDMDPDKGECEGGAKRGWGWGWGGAARISGSPARADPMIQ